MNGAKTYIVAICVIMGAIGAVLNQAMTWPEAIAIIVPAITAMTIRHGISTEAAKAVQ